MLGTQLDALWSTHFASHPSNYIREAGPLWASWERPGRHEWLHDSAEAIQRRAKGDNSLAAELSLSVWNDIHAYAHMMSWKVWEQAHGLVLALNNANLVTACSAARGAIESTIALTSVNERAVSTFQGSADFAGFSEKLGTLIDFVTKSIWGGRMEHVRFQSVNILTLKENLVLKTTDTDTKQNLNSTYSLLCDVVHPSSLGHQLYWGDEVELPTGDQWVVSLDPDAFGAMASALVVPTLWGLGWSVSWTRRAVESISQRVEVHRGILARMQQVEES